MSTALFACSKCNSRHPFEELSQGQQLCKTCRQANVKCTYCRADFQPEGKGSICAKCENNVRQFGKPRSCDYCNLVAAFIGSKCQRCTNSEKKYGAPVQCEQCKQKSAFDRKDSETQKREGKMLCWLCTVSLKRTLAKARISDSGRMRASSSRTSPTAPPTANLLPENGLKKKEKKTPDFHRDRKLRPDVTKVAVEEEKKETKDIKPSKPLLFPDPTSSDHVVALTKLNDQVLSLQRQLSEKDKQLIAKDRQICELKADMAKQDRDARSKFQDTVKRHAEQMNEMQEKCRSLQKQVVAHKEAKKESKAKKLKMEISNALLNTTM
ncbi:protein FAM76A-like [Varroa jacobsoni]|uniref:Protein FAM76A n=1 Tax=Varroa destructor TaxID=109461 RepID=A0A7M7JHK6_VARDE|nr:protein FAM76A-like isoform X2 [Varroa destructor]XP_022704058.1 protein FAM76A-like [Varroa jacobsoni]